MGLATDFTRGDRLAVDVGVAIGDDSIFEETVGDVGDAGDVGDEGDASFFAGETWMSAVLVTGIGALVEVDVDVEDEDGVGFGAGDGAGDGVGEFEVEVSVGMDMGVGVGVVLDVVVSACVEAVAGVIVLVLVFVLEELDSVDASLEGDFVLSVSLESTASKAGTMGDADLVCDFSGVTPVSVDLAFVIEGEASFDSIAFDDFVTVAGELEEE